MNTQTFPHRFILSLSLAAGGCYQPDFSGIPCESSQGCGPLVCINGFCSEPTSSSTGPGTGSAAPNDDDATQSGSGGVESASEPTGGSTATDSSGGMTATSDPDGTNTTDAPGSCCQELDILFVLDQSMSMELQCFEETFASAIYSAIELLHTTLIENIGSYHVGFTTASIAPGNQHECRKLGSLLRGEADDECYSDFLHNKPYLTPEDQTDPADFITSFFCLNRVGTMTDLPEDELEEQDDARPIEALLGSLAGATNAPGGCNEGFSRAGVPLLIVMMTNSDQAGYLPASDGEEPSVWWNATRSLKGFDNAEGQKHLGIVMISAPETSPNPSVCSVDDEQSRLPVFYNTFNPELRRRYDICAMKPDGWILGEKCQPSTEEKVNDFSEFFMTAINELTCDLCKP